MFEKSYPKRAKKHIRKKHEKIHRKKQTNKDFLKIKKKKYSSVPKYIWLIRLSLLILHTILRRKP